MGCNCLHTIQHRQPVPMGCSPGASAQSFSTPWHFLESWERKGIVRMSSIFTRGSAGGALPRTRVPAKPFDIDRRGLGSWRLSPQIKFLTCHVQRMN